MRRERKGFTLIELLVVIAIIAILAAMLFPLMAHAKERARQITCCANLKQLMMAIREYCDDNNGVMPACIQSGGCPDWAGCRACGVSFHVSDGGLWKWVRNAKIYTCSTDITSKQGLQNWELSYSMNFQMGCVFGAPATDIRRSLRLDPETAGRSAKVMILIHEGRDRINDGFFAWGNNWDIPSNVHYNGTTDVYADCHAKWAPQSELLMEMNSRQWLPNTLYYAPH